MPTFEEYLAKARAQFQPEIDAYGNVIAQQKSQNVANTAELKTRLKENAGYATTGFNQQRQNLGLLESGGTAAGLGKISSDLGANLNKTDIQQAINDADLVLKQAGFASDTSTKVFNYATGLQNADIAAQPKPVVATQRATSVRSNSGVTPSKAFKSAVGWNYKANETGGLNFTNKAGNAVTAAQYINAGGGNFNDLIPILQQSNDPSDKIIIAAINAGVTKEELVRRWPYVFGGL
jgi:hypothetical protein